MPRKLLVALRKCIASDDYEFRYYKPTGGGGYRQNALVRSIVKKFFDPCWLKYWDEIGLATVSYRGKLIGAALFVKHDTNHTCVEAVRIEEPHRRKGLASKLYQLIEQKAGIKLTPSDAQSDEAESFWAQPNRPFGTINGELEKDERIKTVEQARKASPDILNLLANWWYHNLPRNNNIYKYPLEVENSFLEREENGNYSFGEVIEYHSKEIRKINDALEKYEGCEWANTFLLMRDDFNKWLISIDGVFPCTPPSRPFTSGRSKTFKGKF